jgi:hypothetical protein
LRWNPSTNGRQRDDDDDDTRFRRIGNHPGIAEISVIFSISQTMALFPMMRGSKKDELYGGPCMADLIEQETANVESRGKSTNR